MGDQAPMNMTNYEQTRDTFRLDVPERFNYTRDVVDAWAARQPDKLALLAVGPSGDGPRSYTFQGLSLWSNRVANLLNSLGVRKGDRLLVVLPRVPEWHLTLLGAFKVGAVPVPGTVQLTSKDMEYRIRRAEAKVAIVDPEGAEKVEAIRGSCPSLETVVVVGGEARGAGQVSFEEGLETASDRLPDSYPTVADDPLLIYFTSGTTGHPKMVLHTHASYGIGHEITARFWHDLGPEDLHWTVSDTGWAKAAWGKLFGQWKLGSTVFMWDARGKPDFELMVHLVERYGVTSFCAPPTVYRQLVLLDDLGGRDWSRLRHCTSAGEPLNPETLETWREATGLGIFDGYGQTETVNLVANYRCMEIKPGSMGRPAPGFEVAVVDEEGNELPVGSEGHIGVRITPGRPVGLFREYWQDEERNREVFRGDWYYTGDRAVVDEDGYFWFVSRADDIIISAGYRIGPFEVESALMEHPAVAETAVIGVPDRSRGQIVKAFVVLAPGHEPSDGLVSEMQDLVKSETAPYKYPRAVEFVEDLPKTVSGKIRRVELREREAARTGANSGS